MCVCGSFARGHRTCVSSARGEDPVELFTPRRELETAADARRTSFAPTCLISGKAIDRMVVMRG